MQFGNINADLKLLNQIASHLLKRGLGRGTLPKGSHIQNYSVGDNGDFTGYMSASPEPGPDQRNQTLTRADLPILLFAAAGAVKTRDYGIVRRSKTPFF